MAGSCALNEGLVTLTATSGWDPCGVGVWLDEACTQPLDLSSPVQWDLADPGDPVPDVLCVGFFEWGAHADPLNLSLSWGPDSLTTTISNELELAQVRLRLDPSTLDLLPGVATAVNLDIEPPFLDEGIVILRVASGQDYALFWADEAKTIPLGLSGSPPEATWDLAAEPAPSVFYLEGLEGVQEQGGVVLELYYERVAP